jgi:hypothetical protein
MADPVREETYKLLCQAFEMQMQLDFEDTTS